MDRLIEAIRQNVQFATQQSLTDYVELRIFITKGSPIVKMNFSLKGEPSNSYNLRTIGHFEPLDQRQSRHNGTTLDQKTELNICKISSPLAQARTFLEQVNDEKATLTFVIALKEGKIDHLKTVLRYGAEN